MDHTEAGPLKARRHTPVIIGNYAPFRLILRESDSWEPTLEEINSISFDYVKLCRLSGFLDIGIRPFSLAIGFDGRLMLPANEEFRNFENALTKFNEVLGILLLGGVYSESIQPDDLSLGLLFFDGYARNISSSEGANASFHSAIQTKHISAVDAIKLLNPPVIKLDVIEGAYKNGKIVFDRLDGLSPSLLLNGVSNFVKKQWSEGLIFLWTTIEQVINIIWKKEIVAIAGQDNIEGRSSFLKDFRIWTTSAKIEILYQKQYLSSEDYKLLNVARKSRNDFVHNASVLTMGKVKTALEGLFRLISLVVTDYKNPNSLDAVLESIYANQRRELYPEKTVYGKDEVTHYLKIPQIPGDVGWDGPYEIIEDLVLKPIPKP